MLSIARLEKKSKEALISRLSRLPLPASSTSVTLMPISFFSLNHDQSSCFMYRSSRLGSLRCFWPRSGYFHVVLPLVVLHARSGEGGWYAMDVLLGLGLAMVLREAACVVIEPWSLASNWHMSSSSGGSLNENAVAKRCSCHVRDHLCGIGRPTLIRRHFDLGCRERRTAPVSA